jgi:hypothetical protein
MPLKDFGIGPAERPLHLLAEGGDAGVLKADETSGSLPSGRLRRFMAGGRGIRVDRRSARVRDGTRQSLIAPLLRPDTLMQLSGSSIWEVHLVPRGRAIHCGTFRAVVALQHHGSNWG